MKQDSAKRRLPSGQGSACHLLVAVQAQSAGSPAPAAENEESKPHMLGDFVFLTDNNRKCRLARIEDIFLLEAFRDATLVHFAEDEFLIRRSLVEVARRLDSSTFFRASRDCIVNLSQIKQPRFLTNGGLSFLLGNGKEVLLSRRQSVLFRTTRNL
jgi:two-component system, LytTR family, response regulator